MVRVVCRTPALGRHLGLVFSHTTRTIGLYPLFLAETETTSTNAEAMWIMPSKEQQRRQQRI